MSTRSQRRQRRSERLQAAAIRGDLLLNAVPLDLEAAEGEGGKLRTFKLKAYDGDVMRANVGGEPTPVVVDLSGMKIGRKSKPILRDHDASRVLGHTTAISTDGGHLAVDGKVSAVNAHSTEVVAAADNGFPWQVSIGASIDRAVELAAGKTATVNGRQIVGPVLIARQTTLREVSILALGADDDTSAKVAATAAHSKKEINMDFAAWLKAHGFDPDHVEENQEKALKAWYDAEVKAEADAAKKAADEKAKLEAAGKVDLLAEQRKALAAEAARVNKVHELCATAKHPAEVHAKLSEIEVKAIGEGWDETKTELEVLRACRPAAPAVHSRSHDTDCNLQALQGAMILRAGGRLDHKSYESEKALYIGIPRWLRAGINAEQRQKSMELAHRFHDKSLVDICAEACRLDGKDIRGGRQEILQAAFSGSALTQIFTTSVNAMLLSTYMETGDTTQGWTTTVDVADFKTNDRIRLSKGPNLALLPRGGEADHYNRSDSIESYKIQRFAKQIVIDEQDIIDDSMNALSQAPQEMGLAAARLRPDFVYAIILANAALGADSIALFHASHSNLNTTSALAAATMKTAIAALEKQQENSVNLNLRATHLIVPSDIKHTAANLLNSNQLLYGADDETQIGNVNTLNSIENIALVSDSRLSNGVTHPVTGTAHSGSTSTWYLASSMGHNIEVAYLRGSGRVPQVRSKTLDEGKYGIQWDVMLDIGAKALDFRGMVKSTA